MPLLQTQHLLTGEELSASEVQSLIDLAKALKQARAKNQYSQPLKNKFLALIFDKQSLRTRMSFMVAMKELGGDIIESVSQTRKKETPEDQIRVLQGYCHAAMVRTFEDSDLLRMSKVAKIPLINGLSDNHHPCQILADLLTVEEIFDGLQDTTICYLGDGNNILHSLLLLAPQMGVNIHYCCPAGHEPHPHIIEQAQRKAAEASIKSFAIPAAAAKDCEVIYTDVWTSMGQSEKNHSDFSGFQVNETLMQQAKSNAVFFHCMPMNRGQEVSETLPDSAYSKIFQQSENRLHIQKAILLGLMSE